MITSTDVTSREYRLYEHYFRKEILPITSFDYNDPSLTYKLVVISRLFDPQIFEDLVLLHNIEKMYGEDMLVCRLLTSSNRNLLASKNTDTFGYDTTLKKLVYRLELTIFENPEEVTIETSELEPIILDKLKVWYDSHYNYFSINSCGNYADLILDFVKEYMQWSKEFHKILDSVFI